MINSGKEVNKQFFIQWMANLKKEATSEEEFIIRNQFPKFSLENKADFEQFPLQSQIGWRK